MIYLAIGSDFQKRNSCVQSLLETMSTKRPDAQITTLDDDSFDAATFGQYISGMGLFDEKSIIKLVGVCANIEKKKYILDTLSELHASSNAFIISEEKLTKTEIGKFETLGVVVKVFEHTKPKSFDSMFDIADLFLNQKKSALLIRYYEYLESGTSAEELVGILLWQVKSLNLSLSYPIDQTGLKPFVYNKCKQSPWDQHTAQQLYKDMVMHYHESRRGGLTLSQRLEKIILNM